MQAVPELVEQCSELGVGEQCRAVAHRRREVAHQVGHRNLHALAGLAAHPAAVHPGPAALVRPGVQIKVEAGDDLSTAQQLEQFYVRVIAVELLHLPDVDPVQAAHHFEQAR